MSIAHAIEEAPSFSNSLSCSAVPEILAEIEFLKELAEGEITTQAIFEFMQTLQRLGIQAKTLRPEAILTT